MSSTVDVLCDDGPRPWTSGTEPWVELRTTHSGAVLLIGDLALKMKLPVRLGFLDFSTHALRVEACRREFELNRVLAPQVYLGVDELPAGEASRGVRETSEPVVVMRRMPAAARLAARARGGADPGAELDADVDQIARTVAVFHAGARRGRDVDREGTRAALRERWEASFEQVRRAPHPGLAPAVLQEVEERVRTFLEGREALFDARVRAGRVVEGHGDLLAEDVFCLPQGPQVLDRLDFDVRLRCLDQLDDVCCLAMDLERLGADAAAARLVSTYTELSGDPAPPSLIHHFIAYRAFVRAKVGCLTGAADDPGTVTRYAELCRDHLRAGAVRLVLVGGPPGTGKSTIAAALADDRGYVVLSSDRVRKELAGLDPEAPAPAAWGSGLYDARTTRRTYDELLRRAGLLLARGESVVLDATWPDAGSRNRAAHLASRAGAELVRVHCVLARAEVERRISGRSGPSDADADTARAAAARWAPWPAALTIHTSQTVEECLGEVERWIDHHHVRAAATG